MSGMHSIISVAAMYRPQADELAWCMEWIHVLMV